jgi:hypothetical protein
VPPFVGEQRQVVGVRETGQLLVGGEGQFVEIEDAVAARVDADPAGFIPVDQVADGSSGLPSARSSIAPSPSPMIR